MNNRKLKSVTGFSLVEVIVAGLIGLILAAAVFTFVSFTGKSTTQIKIMQQLQHESSIITETFVRYARAGQYVTVNNDTTPPANKVTVKSISVRKNNTVLVRFDLRNDSLVMTRGGKISALSAYGAKVDLDSSSFTVSPNGENVDFSLSLFMMVNKKRYDYATALGDVRCRNWALKEFIDPPNTSGAFDIITTYTPLSTSPGGGTGVSGEGVH